MFSFGRMWGVSLYEFKSDLRRKRTYIAFGLILFVLVIVGIVLPKLLHLSISNSPGKLFWESIILGITNDFISGIFPLILGGLIAVDSIAWEFDKGTISALLSQPVSRAEVYFGKFFEKFLLLLGYSSALIFLAVILSYIQFGTQSYIAWTPLAAILFLLTVLVTVSMVFLLGTILRSPGILLGVIFAVFFGTTAASLIVVIRDGFSLPLTFIPVFNMFFPLFSLFSYVMTPSGNTVVPFNLSGFGSAVSSVSSLELLQYSISSVILSIVVFAILGYAIFRRIEIKG